MRLHAEQTPPGSQERDEEHPPPARGSQVSTQIEERFLGGESDRRSIFGGSRNRERMIGLGVVAVFWRDILAYASGPGGSAMLG